MENLNHERAKFAAEQIDKIKDKNWAADFKSVAESAPSLILKNGLSAALAFYLSKKDKEYKYIYEVIAEWIRRRGFCTEDNENILEKCILEMSSLKYAALTEEVLAMLNWLKMFAKAKLSKEGRGDENE